MNDLNISTLNIESIILPSSHIDFSSIAPYIIIVSVLFFFVLLWDKTIAKKARDNDPVWNEAYFQYNTFQYSSIVIQMVFIIIAMIIAMAFFIFDLLSSSTGFTISLLTISIAMIVVAIRVINIHQNYYDKAKETVLNRMGLSIVLHTISKFTDETIKESNPDKIKELASQFLSSLSSDKFLISIRAENQDDYSSLLYELTRCSITGDMDTFQNTSKKALKLLNEKIFTILTIKIS